MYGNCARVDAYGCCIAAIPSLDFFPYSIGQLHHSFVYICNSCAIGTECNVCIIILYLPILLGCFRGCPLFDEECVSSGERGVSQVCTFNVIIQLY